MNLQINLTAQHPIQLSSQRDETDSKTLTNTFSRSFSVDANALLSLVRNATSLGNTLEADNSLEY